MRFYWLLCVLLCLGCASTDPSSDHRSVSGGGDALSIDPVTGVPYAFTFQFPIAGFDTSDFGFGFGSVNSNFCLASGPSGCTEYGAHTGRDTIVGKTPVGTEILAPADGIVRVTTDQKFGAYRSDSSANPDYKGCLIVLEHEFANGQGVTTLLGHVACESGVTYDPAQKQGNPSVGTIVHRGQYLAHVTHYWHGATQTIDWHHAHWGMRKGAFSGAQLAQIVKGYAKKSEFTIDPVTHALTHPSYLDPFVIVAANSDPATAAGAGVRHHPSGTLLEDTVGGYWLVMDNTTIGSVAPGVIASDRYDVTLAVKATSDELDCYAKGPTVASYGHMTLYQRPGSSTVVMASDVTSTRYDVIRWEALVSWGFGSGDLITDQSKIAHIEQTYANKGFKLLRPGTLVKADEESEVAIVTMEGTRIPIISGEVFEDMGYRWEHVVSIPKSVIDQVAGMRQLPVIDMVSITSCAASLPCPGGGNCGGGGVPEVELCNGLDDDGNGQIDEIFQCQLGAVGGVCITDCNTAGDLVCTAPFCVWGKCQPHPEDCTNTIDDDCNGLTDCEDPACVAYAACQAKPDAGAPGPVGADALIHLVYVGPVSPGTILLQAWWQPPMGPARTWGTVTECVDAVAGDGKIDCTFSLPHGTTSFEFQLVLPNGGFWGDESCYPLGGCGQTVGSVMLTADAVALGYQLVPNNPNNQPHMNGWVAVVP